MEKTLSDPPKESANVLSAECHDSVEGKDVKDTSLSDHRCELCGTCFESRRGLSSHARYHLRQLGVALSNSSGAPIDLLSKLIAERGGALPKLKKKRVKQPKLTSTKLKKNVGPKLKIKISNLVKKKYALSSSTSKGSALLGQSQNIAVVKAHKSSLKRIAVSDLTSTLSTDKNVGSELGNASISTSLSSTTAKPLWAPQETDGPLNLATMMNLPLKDDVHVCELCGAWYETSQGLSSHARAHLRQIGVNFDSKAAPVEVLHDLIQCGNLPEKAGDVQLEGICTFEDHSSSSPSTSSSMSRNPPLLPMSLTGVDRGVKKQSAPTKLLLSSKNLKFKSIPRRRNVSSGGSEMMLLSAHLKSPPPTKKQKISTDLSNNLYFSEESESLLSMKQQKTLSRCPDVSRPLLFKKKYRLKSTHVSCEFCHEKFKRKQSLASHVRSHLRQMGIREWFVRGSPLATLREVMSRRGGPAGAFTVPEPSSVASSIQLHSTPKAITEPFSTPLSQKVPKAKKGSRTVFSKPKDEPVEVDISFLDALQTPSTSVASPVAFSPVKTQNTASKTEPAQLVCCNYCGEMFDTRKALSCHARSHLRQLGVKWSPNASPIITLYEFMKREGTANASEIKEEPSLAITVQSKNTTSPPGDNTSSGGEATCELCGFDFENRKALASHARAHLRQLQVDWKVNGSPIETLMAWMKSEPGKVAELHKRYMRGELPLVKKGPRKTSSPGSFCESSHPGVQAARVSKHHVHHRKAGMSHFSSSYKKRHSTNHALLSDGLVHKPTAQSEFNIRSVRGCERRPPKHLSNKESIPGESGALKPHRTGSIPSLVPKPPEHSLVKMVGKVYFLKCRFCEEIFEGPLSIQEDWVMHLQQHILKLKKDSASSLQSSESTDTPLSSHPDAVPVIGPKTI